MRLAAIVAVLAAMGGCSIAIPMSSLYPDDDETTGSINRPPVLSRQLGEDDLKRADAAMAAALDPKRNDVPVAWANPASGAKGSFTPVATAYRLANGNTCRTFLAEVDAPASAAQFMQGSACKADGKWMIHDLRPWKQT
jgi:hypothetical protein